MKQAQEISVDEEEKLWDTGVLGSSTPRQLMRTMFYLNGVHFALRGGQEHRQLRAGPRSQFSIGKDSSGAEYLQYVEDATKNNQGGLQHHRIKPKAVRAYRADNADRCIVTLYGRYMSLCPSPRPNPFYLKELKNIRPDCWYTKSPIGVHTLERIVKSMCAEAELNGVFTNHSLRATAASRLYQNGVVEQLIQEVTGHRSLAVRSYKRTNDAMKRNISAVISGDDCKTKKQCSCSSKNENNITITVKVDVNREWLRKIHKFKDFHCVPLFVYSVY